MTLQAHEVGRSVRGRALLQAVSLTVAPGEMLGLIGPNGSGKSTLLRLMAGLGRPDRGVLTLDGQPLHRHGSRRIARRIALVAQSAGTSDRITVRDAVALGRTPWLDALRGWSEVDDRHVARALARVDLSALASRDWSTLSGGERQRAHIARALAQDPQILLLDEPTNHLDIRHQLQVLDLVAGLGISTVTALHDLNQAMRCDRVAVLKEGRLQALGPPASVLTPDLLARVFDVRATQLTDPQDGSRLLRFQPLA
ncbi:ABC transporter ATP-binding protein [Paracoccus nototheniae]|uniref:ABC transporter ATP-binding protein n=1 Tax=Paracoccus nototheniae TaxID=2489002 RepID=A0ABW4DYS6_9RHOB|nr:ABC transporter ATP-binding protein [Paracoccus nototheniae]